MKIDDRDLILNIVSQAQKMLKMKISEAIMQLKGFSACYSW